MSSTSGAIRSRAGSGADGSTGRGIGEGLDKIAEPRINEGVVVPVWRGVWRSRQ